MSEYSEILDRIEEVLEDKVRPNLALHGGNIRSLDCKDGVYRFQPTGPCAGCPSPLLTTENLIRSALLESIPELKDVVLVGGVSQELLDQAKAILRGERPCGSE